MTDGADPDRRTVIVGHEFNGRARGPAVVCRLI
jgi:hypothetical protein